MDHFQHDVTRIAQHVLILEKLLKWKNFVMQIHTHCKCFSVILLNIQNTNGKKNISLLYMENKYCVCLAHITYINKINNLINITRWKVQGKDNERRHRLNVSFCPLIGSVSAEEGSGVFGEF